MANTNNDTNKTLKAKAATMRSQRILRALDAIHKGEIALLADDSIKNGGGKIYTLGTNGKCSCPDSTGYCAKLNAELAANDLPACMACKHDYARQFANGATLRIARTAYRLKDSILLTAVQPVEAVAPAAPLPTRGYITPESFAAAIAADFAP